MVKREALLRPCLVTQLLLAPIGQLTILETDAVGPPPLVGLVICAQQLADAIRVSDVGARQPVIIAITGQPLRLTSPAIMMATIWLEITV